MALTYAAIGRDSVSLLRFPFLSQVQVFWYEMLYYYDYYYERFLHQRLLMVFHWSLNDSKSPQVSRTYLSILIDLNDVEVWMVSSRPLISKSSNPFTKLLVTVLRAPIAIGIITFMFHSFINSLSRFRYLPFFSLSFDFTLWSTGIAKSTIWQVLFFC